MSHIQFESSRVKEAERQALRESRDKVLADAEALYNRKQAQAERAKERGDHKWMLPSIEAKLSSSDSSKKKKKKERKKSKKAKSKKRSRSSSSSSSEDEKEEWVEKSALVAEESKSLKSKTPEKPLEREEWMSLSGSFLCSSRDEKRQKIADEKKVKENFILEKAGQYSRELNPYWKNGGNGLPTIEDEKRKSLHNSWRQESKASSSHSRHYERRDREEESKHYRRHGGSSNRNRSRSRSHERAYDRQKLPFRKPNDHDHSSAVNFRPSSSVKRWKKPEIRERETTQRYESRKSTSDLKQSAKSESDDSVSEDDKAAGSHEKMEDKQVLTEAELNQLGAKIVKAEIMGDMELAAELKAKLEVARENHKNKPASKLAEEENVILTRFDAKGMARPVEPKSLYKEPAGGRPKAKKVGTHESGQRVRYFADDDKFTLKEMFQREKGKTSAENDAAFVKMVSKSNMDMDELFEQRITREESEVKQDARDRSRAIKVHKKLEKSLDNCPSCFDSKEMLKHTIVAMGSKCYVSLPPHASLTPGHCILSPIHHVPCQTQLDEDVWEEMQNFKKALTKMFMDKDQFPVFFEIFVGQHKFPHMQLQCVPLPEQAGSMAPLYFKKALSECEMEWSTNKKVVDLSKKNVREAIPKGLPYFAVNFGNHGGFAHVIEDERLFPRNFSQEIIGGILDLDHTLWRKPRRQNFEEQRKKVIEFAASWKPYDFTSNNA